MKSNKTYPFLLRKISIFVLLLSCISSKLFAGNFPSSAIQFIENKGQWDANVLFKAELPIGNLFVEKDQLTYLFVDKEAAHQMEHGTLLKSIHFHSVKVRFAGANLNPSVVKDFKSKEYFNYFKGDKKKWASNVFAYKKVILQNLYPHIDLELQAQPDGLKINFIVNPGGDLSLIKLQYEGADKIEIIDRQLRIKTSLGEWIEEVPVSYQSQDTFQNVIETNYTLNGNIVTFKVGDYLNNKVLTIDPSVIFGTYMGSAADNFGFAASYDSTGNAYGAGTVYEANFPVTSGAYDVNYGGGVGVGYDGGEYARDAFLAKFNPDGSQLLFATFIGGSDNEQPHSVTVSPNHEIIIFGTTMSTDFPTTTNAFDRTHNGNADIFISKLNLAGNTLLASTLFGGTQDDGINGIAHYGFASQLSPLPYNYADWFRGEVIVDLTGNIIISTCTQSSQTDGLPLVNAAQGTFGGGNQDGLLLKFSSSLSSVLFSTFVGGNGDDAIYSVCVNNINEIIVGGGTTSSNMQVGSTSFPFNGGADGIIGKYSSLGARQKIIYTGTSSYDQVFFVQTDAQNNIYTMGQSAGLMGMSAGVYGQTNGKQFLQKYDQNLNNILLKTAFGKGGPQPEISPAAFLVDICGRIYISGWGGGTNTYYHPGMGYVNNLPTTSDAFQKTSYDGSDFYLMVLSPNFSNLIYATFYGGDQSQEHVDGGTSHFDKSGIVYQAVCAGCGGLSDFPTTSNAYSRVNPGKRKWNHNLGGCNLGVFKFDMRTYLNAPVFRDTVITVIAGSRFQYNFFATDVDNDIMTFSASSLLFYKVPNPAILKDTVSLPGRYTAHIEWQSLCSDANMDTQIIDVEYNDNACPVSNITKGTIKIVVVSNPVPPPYPDCIQILGDNSVQIKWSNNTTTTDFGKYLILRNQDGSAMNVHDTLTNQNAKNYSDPNATNNVKVNFCYQIVVLNACGVPGDSSRKICSMHTIDTTDAFTGMKDTLIMMKPYDSLNINFIIKSITPKDSVFLNVSGNFLTKGGYLQHNDEGFGIVKLNWKTGCDDISKDTLIASITARNNQCPVAKMQTKKVKIVVLPLDKAPVPTLACPRRFSSDSFEIDWSAYKPLKYTNFIYLVRAVEGSADSVLLKTNKFQQRSYFDQIKVNPTLNICYFLTSSDVCGYFGDSSVKICVQANSKPAPDLNFYSVTVQNDKEIRVTWQKASPDSFWRYQVFKKTGRFAKGFLHYKTIDVMNDTFIVDTDVDVDNESYCYQLVNNDICGNKSINNPLACSILLNGKSLPFIHTLSWTPYDYWMAGVENYEVYKNEPGIYTDKFLTLTDEKTQYIVDNFLNYDNGLYQYTIVAYERNGNLQNSRSNTIDLIQAPLLYIPNAYTENGDGLNDMYKMLPVFVKDFHLQIFNRWGERIFETHDKKQGFNSVYKDKEILEDVYFYIVTYTGWDDSNTTKKGNFTLLK